MSKLVIYDEEANIIEKLDSDVEIKAKLQGIGIEFSQWKADKEITLDMDQTAIIQAYQSEIDKLVKSKGYKSIDVVSMHAQHPDKSILREKFLSEHIHTEDEVRFFVKGSGLFTMHIEGLVYSILCSRNDLISVPANTRHWFDMGENPEFTAIRLFNNSDGWVAKFTGDKIADRFVKSAK
jgi:1,2-dihydroxy-3-keto-5-methylthiopentene dioxygenase